MTVNDTQPPQLMCPANVTSITNQSACSNPPCLVVSYPAPVISDNCPGLDVVCSPPSGSWLPDGRYYGYVYGDRWVRQRAMCSFVVTVFDTAIQDESDPNTILLWNSITGAYRLCCNGITFIGVGKATRQGCVYTMDQTYAADRRVLGRVDKAAHAGSASIQAPAGRVRCAITDRNTLNDTNVKSCQ